MSDITDQVNDIIPKLRNEENTVTAVTKTPFALLQNTLFSFFQNVLTKVQEEDAFKKTIKNEILNRIETDETVTFSQLTSLLGSLNVDNQVLTESILSIFKPAPGSGNISPFIDPQKIEQSQQQDTNAFGELSTGERENINKLTRFLSKVIQDEETEKKNT